MILSLVFIELEHFLWNLHGKIHASEIRAGVKVGSLERRMNTTALRVLGTDFKLLFDRRAIQDIGLPSVAIAAARTHVCATVIQLHFEGVATAFGGFGGNIAEEIKFVLLAGDALEPAKKIVGVENCESPSAFGERREDLLVGGGGFRKLRNDGARLVQRIVVVAGRVAATIPTA